jgi:tripartite-type tricarboxylate transporter receptor subunit TctC
MGTRILAALALMLGLLVSGQPAAETFPTHTVHIIVPTSAGSGPDLIARLLGAKLSERWGQPVVIINKPGDTNIIGTAEVARSPGDGYTMVVVADSYSSNPTLRKTFPFDPLKDIAPVTRIATGGMMLVVPANSPFKTAQELVAYAKAHPHELNYGSPGPGSTHHMMMELFKKVAGIDVVHVPYSTGPAGMTTDLLAGRLDVSFAVANSALTYAKTGKLRILGSAGAKRLSFAPDIPTLAEAGYPVNLELWYGLMAPGTTPPDLVAKIAADATAVLEQPDTRKQMHDLYFDVKPLTPAAFSEMVREDIAARRDLVKQAGITVQ